MAIRRRRNNGFVLRGSQFFFMFFVGKLIWNIIKKVGKSVWIESENWFAYILVGFYVGSGGGLPCSKVEFNGKLEKKLRWPQDWLTENAKFSPQTLKKA